MPNPAATKYFRVFLSNTVIVSKELSGDFAITKNPAVLAPLLQEYNDMKKKLF
jgi:hypothetical protein